MCSVAILTLIEEDAMCMLSKLELRCYCVSGVECTGFRECGRKMMAQNGGCFIPSKVQKYVSRRRPTTTCPVANNCVLRSVQTSRASRHCFSVTFGAKTRDSHQSANASNPKKLLLNISAHRDNTR